MKERKSKTVPWSLRISRGAIAWLHEAAAKCGWSAAEYSRRMLFSGSWEGIVFDECREIEAKIKPGMPIEAGLPYAKSIIERMKQGEAEVREIRDLIQLVILPALDQAEAKITAARELQETNTRRVLGVDAMLKHFDKTTGEGQ
jgi:hypothetical protein